MTSRRPIIRIKTLFAFLLVVAMLIGNVAPVFADASPTGAAIASDFADYAPGSTVNLTGTGWAPGEEVIITVNDTLDVSWAISTLVTADANGFFTYVFVLPSYFISDYTVTASGPISGVATTTFTDLSIGTYDQCSNDGGDGYATGDMGCRWTNGNLQVNNSTYYEGDATVQRLWLTDFVPGSTHTLTLKYGTTKGGTHAYDYLTTWNWSEDWITPPDMGDIISGFAGATIDMLDIPNDPNLTNTIEPTPSADRQFWMYGGDMTSATTPVIVSGEYAGDSETVITISFTVAPSSGSMCSEKQGVITCGVALVFGAHIALTSEWMDFNDTTGAGGISGSPYHVALDAVDGASVGQRDNQMQNNVILPNGTIIIIKDTVPNDALDFPFSLTDGTITENFSLDDDSDATLPNSQTFSVVPGVWTASELNASVNWRLDSIVCVDPTSNTTVDLATATATINVASSETVTCTFTNVPSFIAPTFSKTAAGAYDERYEWTVEKSVNPTSQSAYAGETVGYDWEVVVTKSAAIEENFAVTGVITVENKNTSETVFGLTDTLNDAAATVGLITADADCNYAAGNVTVPAGATATCPYTAAPSGRTATKNVASIYYDGNLVTSAEAAILWTATPVDDEATVTDTQIGLDQTVTGNDNFNAADEYTCSTDPADYTNGTYTYTEDNTATVAWDDTDASDDASTEVICYLPGISKTAAGTYDETYTWEITKSVDPESQSAFAGETVGYEWDVVVTKSAPVFDNFTVTGDITITNPSTEEVVVALSDALSDGTVATITGCTGGTYDAGTVTIAASGTAVCSYEATPTTDDATSNIATFTINGSDYTASAAIVWTANVIDGTATVTDTQIGLDETVTGNDNFNAADEYTCSTDPADYTNGTYTYTEDNTATVAWDDTDASDDASTEVICYLPGISKTAAGTYDETYTWEITKSVDPESQSAFAGETVGYEWDVVVTKSAPVFDNFTVTGDITITNPSTEEVVVALSDALSDGTVATITGCTGGTYDAGTVTIAASGTAVCSYEATPTTDDATSNIATFTINGSDYTASAAIVWTANVIDGTATVTDTQIGLDETVTGNDNFNAADEYTCSTDPADYTNGTYTYTEDNTATVAWDDTDASDDASTEVICYLPGISKTAAGTYDETYTWEITKSVDPESQSAFAGETVGYEWDVVVTKSAPVFDNFTVTGDITITNPSTEEVVVALSDALSDGTVATITGCTGGTYDAGTVTIAASGTAVCSYEATPTTDDATSNIATFTINGSDYTASAAIVWTANVIDGTATVTDTQIGLDETVTGNDNFNAADEYTCSTDPADYTNGTYTYTEDNTATVAWDDTDASDDASTEVICYLPGISKTAAGTYDETYTWEITKSVDPESQSAFAGETVGYEWDVVVTKSAPVFDNFTVTGDITITNPSTEEVVVALSDALSDGTVATITGCTGGTYDAGTVTIAASGTAVCSYEATPTTDDATSNIATFTINGSDYTASAAIVWTANVIDGTATVTDTQIGLDETVTGNDNFNAADEYTCSTDPADYTNGTYTYTEDNTATVAWDDTDASDDASTEVICYMPLVTKTAETYYTRDWDWDITKDYDGTYDMYAGESVTHGYEVTVDPTFTDDGWGVMGTISIVNPNPDDSMVLTSVTDLAGGITGVVTCPTLTVPADGNITCSYDTGSQTSPDVNPFGAVNTATVAFNGANWPATADIVFGAPTSETDKTITVDDNNLTGESWSATGASSTWTYTKDFACSTDLEMYIDGEYSYSHTNTATINETGANDTAIVTITCSLVWHDETAWAYGEGKAKPNWDVIKSSNWGWTNRIGSGETHVVLDLYAGAGQNILANGIKVGTVTVDVAGSLVTVTYNITNTDQDYQITAAHLWVGLTPLPYVKSGKKQVMTDAPGQFPYSPEISADGESATYQVTLNTSGGFWVSAHAVVGWWGLP